MALQTTIASAVSYKGVGLHSGKDVTMELQPADAGTGIVFVRGDLPGQPQVEATAENVTSTMRATTIEANGIKMFTIEHLMSALHGAGVDNVAVAALVKIMEGVPPLDQPLFHGLGLVLVDLAA